MLRHTTAQPLLPFFVFRGPRVQKTAITSAVFWSRGDDQRGSVLCEPFGEMGTSKKTIGSGPNQ
jgi:hypothetical protein